MVGTCVAELGVIWRGGLYVCCYRESLGEMLAALSMIHRHDPRTQAFSSVGPA